MPVRSIVFCIAALVALPAIAQAPEDTYSKLHSAVLAKNLKDVMRYATNARRAEVAANPAAEATIEAMAAMLPRSYTITGKTVAPDGNSAQLRTSGLLDVAGQRAPMHGVIDLRRESGEWRVETWSWSSDRPAVGQTAQATKPAAKAADAPAKPAAQPAAPAKPAAEPTPDAMLGRSSKPAPCVIKPVMSDQDLRNCGARVPLTYEKPR
ncbi:MAG: hypothetical protein ACT4P4_12185 [Betaproteobacteria bacterium]